MLTAELLYREFKRVVGWHLCRHDDAEKSKPCALLRSLSCMLGARLPGYAEALGDGDVPAEIREPAASSAGHAPLVGGDCWD